MGFGASGKVLIGGSPRPGCGLSLDKNIYKSKQIMIKELVRLNGNCGRLSDEVTAGHRKKDSKAGVSNTSPSPERTAGSDVGLVRCLCTTWMS